jgi:hypothetical protein
LLYFNLVGTIADVDETTTDNPSHPAPVLLIDTEDKIERVVLPASVWPDGMRDVLQVGRRLRVAGHSDMMPKRGRCRSRFSSN